ncbi:MAG: hypothetical protein GY725_20535 [bacterium]|nr:hypothetical protein [bacterium]
MKKTTRQRPMEGVDQVGLRKPGEIRRIERYRLRGETDPELIQKHRQDADQHDYPDEIFG